MSSLMAALGIDRSSEAERVRLADEIYDSLEADGEPRPELDRRVAHLSKAERVQLADEIYDTLTEDRELPPISDAMRRELDRRVAWLDANPDSCIPWEEVEARILARLRA